MTRIAVNLLWCEPGGVGGSEQYLVRQLAGLPAGTSPTLFVPPGFADAHPELAARFDTRTAPFGVSRRAVRMAGEATWLHRAIKGFDLVHHGGGAAPLRTARPYVLTIHDLQYRTYPRYFSAAKRAWFAAMLPRSVRYAAHITVPSEYVRATVIDAFATAPDRVSVVPHGFNPPDRTALPSAEELRARHALGDGPLLVYPAMTSPHKNHRLLFELLRSHWTDHAVRLVLIGGEGRAEADVTAAAARDRRIRRLGRVDDATRDGLIAAATAVVFPSEYEGFGAPLIEAMALGAPLLCSDATCVPDIVGDAAVVRRATTEAWAEGFDELMANEARYRRAGPERAATFSVEASGAALARAYAEALA
jgi:glycosyltransferase involved in cell wall biosynthesis